MTSLLESLKCSSATGRADAEPVETSVVAAATDPKATNRQVARTARDVRMGDPPIGWGEDTPVSPTHTRRATNLYLRQGVFLRSCARDPLLSSDRTRRAPPLSRTNRLGPACSRSAKVGRTTTPPMSRPCDAGLLMEVVMTARGGGMTHQCDDPPDHYHSQGRQPPSRLRPPFEAVEIQRQVTAGRYRECSRQGP
jgi:hypothetical protein